MEWKGAGEGSQSVTWGEVEFQGVELGDRRLNRTTEHSYTQAASCESAASELSAVLRASTASVTSGV